MSEGSPVAMTAWSNSNAVAATNASIACLEDILALASRPPARWAIGRVRSWTRTPRPLSKWSTGASNRGGKVLK